MDDQIFRWANRFIECWTFPILESAWARIGLFFLLITLCVTRAFIGLAGVQGYAHDAFMMLDEAWRIFNGQHPHRDFYSHLGLLAYAPTALCFFITHGSTAAYGLAQSLVAIVVSAWAYLLGRRTLGDTATVLLCLAVALMACAPGALGDPPGQISASTTYNRQGYALLALILTESLTTRFFNRKANVLAGAISSGLVLAILLFLKITYFLFGMMLLAVLLPLRPEKKRRCLGIGVGFVALALCFSAYFGFDLIPMARDLLTIGHAKHFHIVFFNLDSIFQDFLTLSVFIAMAVVILLLTQQFKAARLVGIGGLVATSTVLLIFGNHEQTGFPMAVFITVILTDALLSGKHEKTASLVLLKACTLLLASAFIVASYFSGVWGISDGIRVKLTKVHSAIPFDAPGLKGFVPVIGQEYYTLFVNDGLSLLQKNRLPNETVMSLDFTNPFSYALRLKPAPGGAPVLQYRTTFDDTHRQSAEYLFGSADLVMAPRPLHFSDDSLEKNIYRLYGPYLDSHFTLIGKSEYWQLYRRKPSA